MTNYLFAESGFTIEDLIHENGSVLDLGDEFKDTDLDLEEEFSYTPNVNFDDDILNLINMENIELDKDEEESNNKCPTILCGTSFDKLKPLMEDISGDKKLLKLIKQTGVGDVVPSGAQVVLKYVGYFEFNDEPFDSSFQRGNTETFLLNSDSLLPGLELAIMTMRKHETAVFIVHPDLAYGKLGCPPRIPPNAEVMFCINMVDYVDRGFLDEFEKLTTDEKKYFKNIVKRVASVLETAKHNFSKGKVKQAIREYEKAVGWMETARLENDEQELQANQMLSRACINLAICYNKVDKPRRACLMCNKAPIKSSKSHFNHGRALIKIGEYQKALTQLQIALQMEPNNAAIFKEIQLANKKRKMYADIEKRLWEKSFKSDKESSKKSAMEEFAREICEAFAEDKNALRQVLPEGLTYEEYKCIREQAAALGLCVTTHTRNGTEITYLNKSNY